MCIMHAELNSRRQNSHFKLSYAVALQRMKMKPFCSSGRPFLTIRKTYAEVMKGKSKASIFSIRKAILDHTQTIRRRNQREKDGTIPFMRKAILNHRQTRCTCNSRNIPKVILLMKKAMLVHRTMHITRIPSHTMKWRKWDTHEHITEFADCGIRRAMT